MPRLSDSMVEGTILTWLVAEGDEVQPGQPLVEIETDKATVTYEVDDGGTIQALTEQEGATVPVGTRIAVIGEAGEPVGANGTDSVGSPGERQAATAGAATAATVPATTARPPATPQRARPKVSPLARRIAAELQVDLAALTGSGPQGRVIRADVESAAREAATAEAPPAPSIALAADEDGRRESGKGETTTHELTRLQQTVARRMAQSRATVPDIELRVEVDMSEAVALRERLRDVADPAPSLNDFVVKAAALALREFPRVNGAYREAALDTYSRVNVGIAVAAEEALVVPTIFDADRKPLVETSRESRRLAAAVRDGSIKPAELSGATFTVSNLGMHGVDSFSAVINPPQAAILAVGSCRRRPYVDEPSGELVVRPTIILALACDHRIVYGVDGARFLAHVRGLLERPLALLL